MTRKEIDRVCLARADDLTGTRNPARTRAAYSSGEPLAAIYGLNYSQREKRTRGGAAPARNGKTKRQERGAGASPVEKLAAASQLQRSTGERPHPITGPQRIQESVMPSNFNPMTGEIETLHERYQREEIEMEQSAKHTPGPWEVHIDHADGWPMIMAGGAAGKIVANVNPETFSVGVADLVEIPAEANASLIAAAPELLDALQACLATVERFRDSGEYSGSETIEFWPEIKSARAAIAKAAGEQP